MEKSFFEASQYQDKLESKYLNYNKNCEMLFDWYDASDHKWQSGSQQIFFECIADIVNRHNQQSPKLTPAAICKRYQRYRQQTPEQSLRYEAKQWKNIAYLENIPDTTGEEDLFPLPKVIRGIVRQIFTDAHKTLDLILSPRCQYTLNRNDICAHGIWINYKLSEILRENWSLDFPELPWEVFALKESQGLFLVFAGSQMVKNAKLGDKHRHILKKRQEIINSDMVNEQEKIFVFDKNVAFPSPSLAASVLAGVNINGQIYWQDSQGRTFKELHPDFNKIKRGPGRPKKSS